ncbi:membrane protein [Sphingobacterium griseoflavum]|uniref:Membrane protein n=2 Tax=Sphingobacterium griseoflavum TaxID=1474952 RepID=A0ABQ3HUR0_9SPHI|nr:membrane protein [Sphingobacterium griseoflavum]
MMKKKYVYKWLTLSFLSFTLILFAACSENVLDLVPVTQRTLTNFYNNEAQIDAGVNGAYGLLQRQGQYGSGLIVLGEIPSDNTYSEVPANDGGNYGQLDLFSSIALNTVLDSAWTHAYRGIQQCNVILNRIPAVEMDETVKNHRRGEILFIRALSYFNLVRVFGDVPLVVHETTDVNAYFGQGRTPRAEVYRQILSDLAESVALLPQAPDRPGRVALGAALTLQGKVYLTLKRYDEAIAALNQVLPLGYVLLPDPEAVFDPANKNNQEMVFSVQFASGVNGNTEGSSAFQLFSPSGSVGGAKGHNLPTREMYQLYSQQDRRRQAYVAVRNNGVVFSRKFRQTSIDPVDGGSHVAVLRYPDVLLMLAECYNEAPNRNPTRAMEYLDMVRTRAGLTSPTTTVGQAALRDAISLERRLEFVGEGHRWFDLIRTDQAVEVMNAYFERTPGYQTIRINENHLVQPIPQSQINADPATIQNIGYN